MNSWLWRLSREKYTFISHTSLWALMTYQERNSSHANKLSTRRYKEFRFWAIILQPLGKRLLYMAVSRVVPNYSYEELLINSSKELKEKWNWIMYKSFSASFFLLIYFFRTMDMGQWFWQLSLQQAWQRYSECRILPLSFTYQPDRLIYITSPPQARRMHSHLQ